MEAFAMLKMKRKELSFNKNSARGLNCREDRLLESALGTIEKERQRSLSAIENEFHNIHHSLKDTVTLRRHESSPTLELIDLSRTANEKSSRSQEDSNNINNNFVNAVEKGQESTTNPDYPNNHCFPSIKNITSLDPVPAVKRILSRRRNISTGSIPSEGYYDNGKISSRSVGSPLLTRRSEPSSNYCSQSTSGLIGESTSKNSAQCTSRSTENLLNTNSGKISCQSVGSPLLTRRSEPSSNYCSQSTSGLIGESTSNFRVQSTSSSSENLLSTNDQVKLFHRRNVWMKRTISSENINTVLPSDNTAVATRRTTYASYGTSPVTGRVSTPIRQRKIAMSAESSPLIHRRMNTEKNLTFNPQVSGHQRVARMVSCPTIGHINHSEFQSLKSSEPLSILTSRTQLPDLSHENQAGFPYETSGFMRMCVSPKNSEGSHMDKNLQKRIDAFLDSLPVKDEGEIDED